MSEYTFRSADREGAGLHGPSEPGGLLDILRVAAVVLDSSGRITLWSPQAEELFGYTAEEALGRYAADILVEPEHLPLVLDLFAQVIGGGSWAGVFPCRHKDGSVRQIEFRNFHLTDNENRVYALGIATDQARLRRVETDLALTMGLFNESPIGLAVFDTDLRYILVNPALERINGIPAEEHIGRRLGEMLPQWEVAAMERSMRRVLATGTPILDQHTVGRTAADPDTDHAWSVSHYRLQDTNGRVLGLASLVVDITERHRAEAEAARARQRLTTIADATVRIGTTLDLDRTARELADTAVDNLADLAAVDVLDAVLRGQDLPRLQPGRPTDFRALAVATAYPTEAEKAADPIGEIVRYDSNRLIAQCVATGEPVFVPRVGPDALERIARNPSAAMLMARAGVHSYMAVPLIARGQVLGALTLCRARNPLSFDDDDLVLASELATRAAVCIDNARWYRHQRHTALALQRSLLPKKPPRCDGLEIAYRYRPAGAASEIGGDWFDVLPLCETKTALVVGDVMGSGINAAAAMGQLRTATQTLTKLDLAPAEVLRHLDEITGNLESSFATCVFAVYDPRTGICEISSAGHLPPVLVSPEGEATLVGMPSALPLGVGGTQFETTRLRLRPGSGLVLYTDGLVETRTDPIDARLDTLVRLLAGPARPLEETCDQLLDKLRHGEDYDDVALLIARVTG